MIIVDVWFAETKDLPECTVERSVPQHVGHWNSSYEVDKSKKPDLWVCQMKTHINIENHLILGSSENSG